MENFSNILVNCISQRKSKQPVVLDKTLYLFFLTVSCFFPPAHQAKSFSTTAKSANVIHEIAEK